MISRRNHERHIRYRLSFSHHRRRLCGDVRTDDSVSPDPPGLGGPVGSGPSGLGSVPGQPGSVPGSGPNRPGSGSSEGGLQGLTARQKIARRIGSTLVETLNH